MLITVPELASALQEDVDTATATLAIEIATGAVQAAAGQRIIEVVNDQVVIDLDELDTGQFLYLPEGPVTAVASATVGATAVTDFVSQLSRGRLWRSLGWRSSTLAGIDCRTPSTATVTYTHGWPAGDQKLQLARAVVLELAKSAYSAAGGLGAVVREQLDDYSVQYAQMAASVESALTPDSAFGRALRRLYGLPRRSAQLVKA
jgi:hypothetical protein